jgi:hypothetical protein
MPIAMAMSVSEFLLGWTLVSAATAVVVGPLLRRRPQPIPLRIERTRAQVLAERQR